MRKLVRGVFEARIGVITVYFKHRTRIVLQRDHAQNVGVAAHYNRTYPQFSERVLHQVIEVRSDDDAHETSLHQTCNRSVSGRRTLCSVFQFFSRRREVSVQNADALSGSARKFVEQVSIIWLLAVFRSIPLFAIGRFASSTALEQCEFIQKVEHYL